MTFRAWNPLPPGFDVDQKKLIFPIDKIVPRHISGRGPSFSHDIPHEKWLIEVQYSPSYQHYEINAYMGLRNDRLVLAEIGTGEGLNDEEWLSMRTRKRVVQIGSIPFQLRVTKDWIKHREGDGGYDIVDELIYKEYSSDPKSPIYITIGPTGYPDLPEGLMLGKDPIRTLGKVATDLLMWAEQHALDGPELLYHAGKKARADKKKGRKNPQRKRYKSPPHPPGMAEQAVRKEGYYSIEYKGKMDEGEGPLQAFHARDRDNHLYLIGVGRQVVTDRYGRSYGDVVKVRVLGRLEETEDPEEYKFHYMREKRGPKQLKLFKNPLFPLVPATAENDWAANLSSMEPNIWYISKEPWSGTMGRLQKRRVSAALKRDGEVWRVTTTERRSPRQERGSSEFWVDVWWENAQLYILLYGKELIHGKGRTTHFYLEQPDPRTPTLQTHIFKSLERLLEKAETTALSASEHLYHATKKNPVSGKPTKAGKEYYWNRPGILPVFHRNVEKGDPEFPTIEYEGGGHPDYIPLFSGPYWFGEYWNNIVAGKGVTAQSFIYLLQMPSGKFDLRGKKTSAFTPGPGEEWFVTLNEAYPPAQYGAARRSTRKGLVSSLGELTFEGSETDFDDTMLAITKSILWAENIAMAPGEQLYWGAKVKHLKSNPSRRRRRRRR